MPSGQVFIVDRVYDFRLDELDRPVRVRVDLGDLPQVEPGRCGEGDEQQGEDE